MLEHLGQFPESEQRVDLDSGVVIEGSHWRSHFRNIQWESLVEREDWGDEQQSEGKEHLDSVSDFTLY